MFWCELVAAGIGGRTIAEAKQNISYAEAQTWAAYMRHYSGLNVTRAIEHQGALVATMLSRLGGGRGKYNEFLPKRAPVYEEGSIEHVMAMLQGSAK